MHIVRGTRREEIGVTILNDRPNTALVVVDVQNDVVAGAHRRDEVIANITRAITGSRIAKAEKFLAKHGWTLRVMKTEKGNCVGTCDLNPSRFNGHPLRHYPLGWMVAKTPAKQRQI